MIGRKKLKKVVAQIVLLVFLDSTYLLALPLSRETPSFRASLPLTESIAHERHQSPTFINTPTPFVEILHKLYSK